MNTMEFILIRCGRIAGGRNATNNMSRTKRLQSKVAKQTITPLLMIIMYFISSCHATDPGQLRLMGMHNGEGIVEITNQDQWGLICASRWTMFDGDVACRQLGYEGVTRVMRVTPGREDRINVHGRVERHKLWGNGIPSCRLWTFGIREFYGVVSADDIALGFVYRSWYSGGHRWSGWSWGSWYK